MLNNKEHAIILAEILLDFGVHCVGCEVSSIETLGEGVLSHGFTEKQLDQLVKDLNEVIGMDPKGIW